MFSVSVITTLYNYKNYIEDCILSFLQQNFLDSEMIIVDDFSSDNSYEIIKKYENNRLKYIKLDKNYGYSHAKNVGIKNSQSEILVMLDSDDLLVENSLLNRYKKIQEGYDLVHGPVLDISGEKDNLKIRESKMWKQWMSSKKNKSCYKLVHAQSVMLRKEIHRKIGLYDENLRCKSDREMWARIFNYNFKIGWIDTPVSMYRKHSQQMHRSLEKAKNNDRLQSEVLSLIKKRSSDLSGLEFLQ